MPETSIQRWKSRPIFLSSTFRDMHAERDHLRQHVFPRLEEELLKRRHHLEWIDLRQGVESAEGSTEEQRELFVLKVCLDEIKRSRPFMIVLLGDRYGWVPPADRLNAAAREANFSGPVRDHSVTALEIEFGILKETPNQQRRCFFYFREPLPYAEMPPEVRATYSEQFGDDDMAAARWSALEELKKRLTDDDELKPRIRSYSAGWDAEKNTVTGLEKWGDDVFEDLWRELEKETREFAARPAPTWQEIERDALAEFVEHRSRNFTGRDDVTRQLLALAKSPVSPPLSNDSTTAGALAGAVPWGACVTGTPGGGKSALFAKLVSELERDPNVLLLANAAGSSPRSASVDAMLRRWIAELAVILGVGDPIPEKVSVEEVDQTFASLLDRVSTKQRVVVLLDALNQFEPTPRSQHMTWLPKLWPPNARLVATALPGAEARSLLEHTGVEEIELRPLTEANAREIGRGVWRRYHCPWSNAVWQALAAKTLPDAAAAVGNPLWTTLACEQLALLDADDFTRAELQFADEKDPQARLTQFRRDLVEKMPPDVPGLYAWLLVQTEKIHGETWAGAFALAIALSRNGWRERDLEVLVPALAARLNPETPATEISPLQLAALRRSFRAHLAVHGELQQWDFFHVQMREAITRNLPADQTAIHSVLADHLLSLPSDDPLHDSETMVHLLAAEDHARAAGYYGGSYLTAGEERGATDVLADHVLAGEAREPNPALVMLESLLLHAERTENQTVAILCNRFQFGLNDAIANQARLPTRRQLHGLNLRFLEGLAAAHPSNADWQRDLSVSHDKVGDVLRAQGDLAGAMQAYGDSLQIAERLAAADPSNAGCQHDLSVSHERIGVVLQTQGDLAGAMQAYRDSLQIRERLAAADPSNAVWQRDLSVGHDRIGDVLRAQGDPGGAVQAYRVSLQIRERLAAADPSNARWQRGLSVSHDKVGDILQAQGDHTGAVQAYRASLRIRERLAAADPSNTEWQHTLCVSHELIGNVLLPQGDLARALKAYRDSLQILERLAAADPSNAEWQRDLSSVHVRVGNVLLAQGDLGGAVQVYRASLQDAERLAAADPSNAGWQRDLSVSHDKVGDVLQAQGDLGGAMPAYRASLQIRERLAAADPSNAEWQRDLSFSHDNVGDILQAQGDLAGAVLAYRASLQIRERLAAADPSNAEWQRDFCVSCWAIAKVLNESGDASCFDYLRRAYETLSDMKRRGLFLSQQHERILALLRDNVS